jgi:subtilisin-like proprotein convertase family protein
LSWDAIPGATSYRVEVANNAQFSSPIVDTTVPGTSLTLASALAANTEYFWRVSATNRCGAGQASSVRSFTTSNLICSEPALNIPDNNPTGATDTLNVVNTGTLDGLRLGLKINHTWIGDLRVWLSKGSTTVELVNRPGVPASTNGCNGDNMDIILADGSALSVQSNCANANPAYTPGAEYSPANPLAAFTGTELSGAWSLRVSDNVGADTGQLVSWCLLPAAASQAPEIFKHGFESTHPASSFAHRPGGGLASWVPAAAGQRDPWINRRAARTRPRRRRSVRGDGDGSRPDQAPRRG